MELIEFLKKFFPEYERNLDYFTIGYKKSNPNANLDSIELEFCSLFFPVALKNYNKQ